MIPNNFIDWKHCIEVSCGITLTAAFASKRITELGDDKNHHTIEFVKLYGDAYRKQVINWFERSLQMQNELN
jgi:hypothetical protein